MFEATHTHTPILLAAGSDLWNAAGLDYDVLRSVCSVLPDSRLTAIDLAAASWVHIGRVPLRSLTITHLEDLCAHLQATTHEPGGVWSQA